MAVLTQASRLIAVESPLGKDVLLFRRMTATEGLNRLFEFNLDLLSENNDIKFDDILGQNVTVRLALPESEEPRYFNGYVSRFSYVGIHGRYAAYQATLRPWFWLLTRTADCRIFQEQKVPDIIKEVFRDGGFTDFEERLSGSYRQWEYCVQYRETDFNFLSRLMEQEGIYFYFKHTDNKHTLVLADSYSAHEPVPGYEEIPYFPPDQHDRRKRDHIFDWTVDQQVQSGACALNDFDFKAPKKSLRCMSAVSRQHAQADFEIYDYPGVYVEPGDGDSYSRVRIEELQAQHEVAQGRGDARGLCVGALFKLTDFPRTDQNREYLLLSATHELQTNEYESDRFGEPEERYECAFSAMDAQQPYRAPRLTPKPVVQGPQTAIVVGKAGEEIWTDQYGRVKVQFHWDRYGKLDENSSCWVRVSHPWAGKNWGAVAIPRMGQEVIVDFLEGDPDQPIITGRVYNGDQMPPYELPANKTQTGILSRSSKGGSGANCNELRFEDKKGDEQVYLHAEKNQDIEVENDETHWVGHDRRKTIDNDESILIGRDRTMTIKRDKSETVERHKVIQINGNHSENIDGAMSIVVGKTLTESVLINYAETVGGAMELTVGAALAITVGAVMSEAIAGAKSEAIGGSKSESIGGNKSQNVGKSLTESVKENQTVMIGKDLKESIDGIHRVEVKKESTLKAKKVQINAEDEINFKTGSAEIIMKKNGDITIKGNKITIKGSSDVIVKGSKIAEN